MKNSVKYAIGLAVVLLLRLLPHPPNVEPITATLMPFAKRWGMASAVIFAVSAVLLYDIITGTIGVWTLFTAGAYAILAVAAALFFARAKGKSTGQYLAFAVFGTILFDAMTGLTVGPLFFDQPFMAALVGQIPFTIMHLAGNVVLALVVSPLIERFVVGNEELETSRLRSRLEHLFSREG